MATQISHDSFARESLMRDKASKSCSCQWCGHPAPCNKRSGRAARAYRARIDEKPFCSVGCFRSYYF